MPGRKKTSAVEWKTLLVYLEEIRLQNRATIEVVEARYDALTQRLDGSQKETRERFVVVESSIRALAAQIREVDEGSRTRDTALAAQVREGDERSRARDTALAAQIREVDEESRTRDAALAAQIGELDDATRARDESLEMAVREVRVDVRENGVELHALASKVEALSRLEDRVAALEKRAR
jgi:hypothetical protein